MPLESAKQFVRRVHEDEAFRTSVAEKKLPGERQAHLRKENYEFTDEQLRQAYRDFAPELTDEELEGISAGGTDIEVTLKNRSNDANNSQVVIFTKNVATP